MDFHEFRRARLAGRLAAVHRMPIPEALTVFGYPATTTSLDAQELKARYRQLSFKNHPDHGGSDQQMMLVNNAYETLSSAGQNLQEPPSPPPGGGPRRPGYGRPQPPTPEFTQDQRQAWIKRVLELGYVQVIYNEILSQLPMDFWFNGGVWSHRPIGSKRSTKRMPLEELKALLLRMVQMDSAVQGCTLLAMEINENWKEAWMTFRLASREGREVYQSIRFAAPPEKKVKVDRVAPGRIQELLRSQLQLVGGGSRNTYYGLPGVPYQIKLQPRAILLVRRNRPAADTKLKSSPYEQLTEVVLQSWINLILSKR